jgi:hypothetical protein
MCRPRLRAGAISLTYVLTTLSAAPIPMPETNLAVTSTPMSGLSALPSAPTPNSRVAVSRPG